MTPAELSTVLANALAESGSDTVFGLPGGGNNLDFIGAAESAGLRFVLAHAETPAVMMAAVYGDLTNALAACVVTRGPGAASAVNGVAHALLDRQQVLVVTDAVSAADEARIAHQRLDQPAIFGPITKWSARAGIGDTSRTVQHALQQAMSPPRGPVHLDFDPAGVSVMPPTVPPAQQAGPEEWERAVRLLKCAERPVAVLGVGARGVVDEVRALVGGTTAPVLMTYRAKGVIPDSWRNAAGLMTGGTTEAPLLDGADLIVMIGVDSVELIPRSWPYTAPVLAVNAWRESSSYYGLEAELVGDLRTLTRWLAYHWPGTTWPADTGNAHRDAELGRLMTAGSRETPTSGAMRPQEVVRVTRELAPAGAIATVDSGAHMLPAMSLWATEDVDEVLISSGLATMGFALPAAIGAALARPGRRIICFTGDGGLGMSLGELETLARLGLAVTVVVFNDSRLSLIAIKAKPQGNGGENAVAYHETDFATVASGYGIRGTRVTNEKELTEALRHSFAHLGPTLLDVRIDASGYAEILDAIRGER